MRYREDKEFKEDLAKYREMCDIADKLVELSVNRRALERGDQNIVEFMQKQDKVDAILKKLDNPTQAEKHLSYIQSSDKDRNMQLLLARITKVRKERRTLLLKRITAVAAVLFVSFCVFYIIPETNKPIQIIQSNTNTNYDAPVILLSNGEKINLLQDITDKSEISKYISMIDKQTVKYNSKPVSSNEEGEEQEYNTIIVPSKQIFSLELADGTEVVLNANSSLRYPVNFKENKRDVELQGEAYFKVAKSDKPFIVKVGDCAVKVYGTEFNINMNRKSTIETILVEGSIGFTTSSDKEIMLKPNQMMKISKGNDNYEMSYVNVNRYLGWKTGCFFYEQEQLQVILNDIASWYGVFFIIENKNIGLIEMSINLDRNMKLSELISNLEKILEMKFINDGNNKYIII